jgi:lipid A ethanolaminephosphotransferase
MSYTIIQSTKGKVYQAPVPYRVPLLLHYAFVNRMPYYGPREEPYMDPTRDPIADHVVFLVDESIRGDYLGVNGSSYDTTPFLDSIRDEIFNFGVISSASNLSDSANIVLQSGLRPDQFPDTALRSLKNPSIFSYLQRAGFAAFLIDGQIYSGQPQNFVTGFDVQGLDGYLLIKQLDRGLQVHEVDRRIIDYVGRIVSENERSFTYVVKVGAHFPYESCYPIEETFFAPTRAMDAGSEQERMEDSYLNSLRWNVDGFLRELLQAFGPDEEEVLIVYTSDHGQSFWESRDESGRPVRGGHGTLVDPPASQAMVPLILLTPHEGVRTRLSDLYDASVKDRASAFELFPSLLYLVGYDEGDIRRHYHHTIFEGEADRSGRGFISGNLFGIGGTSTWNELAPGRGSG